MTTKVTVVTQDDPFYMPIFFEALLSSLPKGVQVTEVTVLRSFDESFPDLFQRMYKLYGPVNFVRRGIEYVHRKLLNRFGGDYSVAAVARDHGVAVTHRDSVNTDAFVSGIEHDGIDVILSASAPEIFDSEVLAAPDWGCLNVHTAELPKYRGMLPTFWALYHGDDEIGVTVHTMAEEIDQGQIVRQTTFPIESASLDDAIRQGKRTGGRLAAAALGDIERDKVMLAPMEGEGSYFSFPTRAERKEFQRRGGRLL